VLSIAYGAGRVADLLTQLVQVAGQGGFSRIGEVADSQQIRAALHAGAQIVFVQAIERASQLAGRRRLRGRELARRSADLLREVRQVVAHLLAIADHFVEFLLRNVILLLARGARGAPPGNQVPHVVRLLLLPGRQLIGRLGHRLEAAGGVLLLHSAKQVGGFAQTVGGAPGIGRAGIPGDGALEVFIGLTQAVERLLGRLLAAVGSLVRGLLWIGAVGTVLAGRLATATASG